MSLETRESQALSSWKPPRDTSFNRFLTAIVVALSRTIMRRMNSLTVEGADRFERLLSRGGRGFLTFSNHVSLFDDPLLLCNLRLPPYRDIRWVASDAINFFGSPWKAFIFGAGRCVPIVRGAGFDQPGFKFLRDRLREGAWVHIFPEGKRTRDPQGLLSQPFKSGIGRLMAEARPLALPFYHYGMHEVLPLGARAPRWRRQVRLVFAEPFDCDVLVREICMHGNLKEGDPGLWQELTDHAAGILRRMERRIHPEAVGGPGPEQAPA